MDTAPQAISSDVQNWHPLVPDVLNNNNNEHFDSTLNTIFPPQYPESADAIVTAQEIAGGWTPNFADLADRAKLRAMFRATGTDAQTDLIVLFRQNGIPERTLKLLREEKIDLREPLFAPGSTIKVRDKSGDFSALVSNFNPETGLVTVTINSPDGKAGILTFPETVVAALNPEARAAA